jgi:hypothetical protein
MGDAALNDQNRVVDLTLLNRMLSFDACFDARARRTPICSGRRSAGKPNDVAIEIYRSNGRTPKKLAGIEGGGSLPDARRFTHHLTASAARLLEELSLIKID